MLPTEIKIKHWKNAFYWSLLFLVLWGIYFYFWQGFFNFGSFVSILASTAAVMIAISFLFGTFTFYTDFLDRHLAYRKYFGLVGYWYLVLHFILVTILNPTKNIIEPLRGNLSRDQVLGLTALLVLTFMMAISHETAMVKIGPKLWRSCLRLGYLIYPLLILRAFGLEGHLWRQLFSGETLLPPPSLMASILALFVILFRLSVYPVKLIRKIFYTEKDKLVTAHDAHPDEPSHPDFLHPVTGPTSGK